MMPPQPPSLWSRILTVLGVAMFAAMLVLSAMFIAPTILTDFQVRGTAEPIETAQLVKGRCSSRVFVHLCDLSLSLATKSRTVTRDVHYLFFDPHLGNYTVEALADLDQPELLTTDLGLDKLWNRVISLAVLWALLLAFLAGAALAVHNFFRRQRITA